MVHETIMTELEQQEAITSNIAITVTVIALMAMAMLWMWLRYREYLASKSAEVAKERHRVRQMDVAFRHLKDETTARLEEQIAKRDAQIKALLTENAQMRRRLETIVKAGGSHGRKAI